MTRRKTFKYGQAVEVQHEINGGLWVKGTYRGALDFGSRSRWHRVELDKTRVVDSMTGVPRAFETSVPAVRIRNVGEKNRTKRIGRPRRAMRSR